MQLSDYLNDINHGKENLLRGPNRDEALKDYTPWVINKALSFGIDTVLYADEMNRHYNLDKQQQYDYYIAAIRKKKRFNPWIKGDNSKDVSMVAKYFQCNINKAKSMMKLFSDTDLKTIKERAESDV